ncbi:MAG TPA: PspC domain-containing protein [Acidimicrobiales bacterium]|nr:PspC domain-containing protein [Acidimicrobiales bacterium]
MSAPEAPWPEPPSDPGSADCGPRGQPPGTPWVPPRRESGGPWGPPGRRGRRRRGRHPHRHWRRSVRRSAETRVLAGVCGGLSTATGVDVTLVRIAFALLTLASGVGILIYGLAWLVLPLQGEDRSILSRALTDRRGIRLVIAIIPLFVMVVLVAGALHIGFVGSFIWPVFLAAGAAMLIRRNASEAEKIWINGELMPMFHTGVERHPRWKLVGRIAVGLVIGIGGVSVATTGHGDHGAIRSLVGALLVIAAIIVIFGPWWLSLARDLLSERQARALAEERALMAAHVHDSVLQTLALIQRSADDPRQVVRLARAQERELRSWLFEGRSPGTIGDDAATVAEGIDVIQRQVERDHGIAVQVVVVGDCPLTDGLRALLDASREATVNAATWSGAAQVSVYAEVEPDVVTIFVRDRGRGFEPGAVPDDRQGIAQSIRGRVARCGGSAAIRSAPGAGTEVELSMPRRARTA